jgi:hypothetical protein
MDGNLFRFPARAAYLTVVNLSAGGPALAIALFYARGRIGGVSVPLCSAR